MFWIFRSLVKKHHRQVFQFVLRRNGLSPDKVMLVQVPLAVVAAMLHVLVQITMQIVPLTAADHKELQQIMQQIQAEKQAQHEQHPTASMQNPVIEWLIWIVKPPTLSSGRAEYVIKRLVTAPFRYAISHTISPPCTFRFVFGRSSVEGKRLKLTHRVDKPCHQWTRHWWQCTLPGSTGGRVCLPCESA